MTDLKALLEHADRAVSRVPLPPDGLEGLGRRRDRKHRNQRIVAGVVGFAVFLSAIWIVTTGGPFDRTDSPTPGGGGQTGPTTAPAPHPVGVGLLGFPPEGATPSTPERGELVVGFVFGHTSGDPGRFGMHVYADGRVIWQRLGQAGVSNESTGLIEQRLTPEGVELVRAEVLSTGLIPTGGDPGRFGRVLVGSLGGLHYGSIEVRTDRLRRLGWGDVGHFGEGHQPVETEMRPEDVAALKRLDEQLEDLLSWLPSNAWEDPQYRAFVPSRYSVCYSGAEVTTLDRPRILDLLPAPVGDALRLLDTVGNEFRGPLGSVRFWCSTVTTDEARAMAVAIEEAGASRNDPQFPSFRFAPTGGPEIDISFDPLLPHD